MVPIECTEGNALNFSMRECDLPGLRSYSAISEFHWRGWHCWETVTNEGNVLDLFCERIGSMLNETCPADIAFREVTLYGQDELVGDGPHTPSAMDYVIGGLFLAGMLNLGYQIYLYSNTKRDG